MLAMADKKGRVWAAIPGLANTARVTIEECEQALARFMAPDKYSRTPDNDGRRIEPIDGGWQLLNYTKYREMRDADERAAQNRASQEAYRSKQIRLRKPEISQGKPQSAQTETERERETEKSKASTGRATALPSWLPEEPWEAWLEVRKKMRAPNTDRALKLAIGSLEKLRAEGQDPGGVLDQSTQRGWRGLFPVSISTGSVPDYSGVAANIKD